ncbi:MAG: pantoate--beta-alanine ligase [Anaerolineae bacterium]|nr:pantoate--beta-alanine ligase [Anaerolineae bacterium]
MQVTPEIKVVRRLRWADPTLSWGFVPTMGYLHAGHLSLVERARADNDRVAVSIYVNPTQFAPTEDLSTYPRNMERDLALLREVGVDLVFTPDNDVMYPPGFQTSVSVNDVSQPLEGASRPTHFAGVTVVVAKLFNIMQPTRAYFGQKDAQQVIVLQRMVRDLNFNLDLVVCPTGREPDGLAMSSRNVHLSPEQRSAATVLSRCLREAVVMLHAGERDGNALRALMRDTIVAEPLATIDYVSVADPETLQEVEQVTDRALLSLAVFFGRIRLIDNMLWLTPTN